MRVHAEGDAGHPDAVEVALQDRGKTEVPDGVDEEQRLGRFQPLHVGRDAAAIRAEVVIVDPILPRQHGIEGFGVQVAVVHFVTAAPQRIDRRPVQTCHETRFDRVSIEDEDTHRRV